MTHIIDPNGPPQPSRLLVPGEAVNLGPLLMQVTPPMNDIQVQYLGACQLAAAAIEAGKFRKADGHPQLTFDVRDLVTLARALFIATITENGNDVVRMELDQVAADRAAEANGSKG